MAGLLAAGAQALGGIIGAYGTIQKGKLGRKLGRLQKKEYTRAAKQEVAVSQRAALEEQRQAELLASRAIAVAAAGGGGADDPTVTKIIADIKGEGAYRAALQMYEGEEKAKKLRFQGAAAEFEGEAGYKAAKTEAISSLLGTGASMYSTYKMGGYG